MRTFRLQMCEKCDVLAPNCYHCKLKCKRTFCQIEKYNLKNVLHRNTTHGGSFICETRLEGGLFCVFVFTSV